MQKTNKVGGQAFLDINSSYKDITMLKNCDIGIKIDQWNRIKSIKTYVFLCICTVNIIQLYQSYVSINTHIQLPVFMYF